MENEIILYTDENGKTNVSVRFADEDVWVTAVQLAEIYNTSRQNIGQHLENIYKDNELPREATIKKFFIVQKEGNCEVKREIDHYNLDVIIAIGYRVQSDVAVRFRRWATQRLHEHTAAELIYERVDSEKPFVGMTNFKGDYVTKDDVKIAKNYLSELELKRLNLLVSEFLDFAEFQALEEKPMKMQDWITALDNQIVAHQRKILEGKGSISHEQAMQKAEKEYDLFRQKELANLKSDFDLFLQDVRKIETR